MKIKNNGGYVVPIAIGILVIASLGLLLSSWLSGSKKTNPAVSERNDKVVAPDTLSSALKQALESDDQTLDADGAIIDEQLKILDNSNADVNNSLNDSSII